MDGKNPSILVDYRNERTSKSDGGPAVANSYEEPTKLYLYMRARRYIERRVIAYVVFIRFLPARSSTTTTL